ncbi:MAG: choice-of-anchor D domain-containing protein [Candidatus Acidiferrales bacterium]
MNIHGPKFHRSQQTSRRLVFHKWVRKKNTFTLISIATLMLAILALRTSAAASPKLVAAPGSLTFGTVSVASNSTRTVTLTNSGITVVTISRFDVSGRGFSMSKVATPWKLPAGQSIHLEARFTPVTAGAATGSIAIISNASDPSLTIGLSGTGAQGRLSATPASASFGDVVMGDNSSKAVRLSNTGTSSLTISHLSVIGKGFSMTTLVTPLKLAVGQSISLEPRFTPVTTGAAAGSIAITSNASDPSLTIGLSGIGTQSGAQGRLSATPASASLGNVVVGQNNSQTIRLSNTGDGNVTISRVSVSGSDFRIAGLTVPTVIASGKSATFNVQFTPTSSGSIAGTVSLVSDASNSPLTISVSGTGVAATRLLEASSSALNFGTVNVDTTSSLSLTLTNRGNVDVTISKVAVSGAGFSQGGVAAGTILGPDQSTTLRVAFAPASAGSVNGDVAVTSNAATSAMMISLSGTAVQSVAHSVALAWDASKSSGVVGYNVYRATVSGGPYTKLTPSAISETQYTDTTVEAGHIYYYVVTSVDSNGVQSSYSNQVSVTIPTS